MGLPDEGLGPLKRRSRLGLNSKRKEIHKEASVADEQLITSSESTNKIMAATQDATVFDEGKNAEVQETLFSEGKESLVAPVSSLYNIGNTCYLNAMLQTLRYTPGFIKRLAELREVISLDPSRMDVKVLQGKKKSERAVLKLVMCLDNLYRQMRVKESDYRDISPTDSAMMAIRPDALLDQIRLLNPLFEGNFQHDAQELLRCLLGCLDDAEVELDKEQSERRGFENSAKSCVSTETLNSKDVDLKYIKGKMEDETEGRGVLLATSLQTQGKSKTKKKEKECKMKCGSTIMTNFFNRETSKSLSSASMTDGSENVLNVDLKNEGLEARVERNEHFDRNLSIIEKSDIQDAAIMSVDKNYVGSIESIVNNAGDAPDCRTSNTFLKSTYSPSKEKKKRMRLGMRGQSTSIAHKNSNISGRIDEQLHEKNLVTKPADRGDEVVIISSSDEDERLSQSGLDHDFKSSSCDDIIQIGEEPYSGVSKTKSVSTSNEGKEDSSPERESSPVAEQKGMQHLTFSPGKRLTIHSPQEKNDRFHSPKLPSSQSFLSRIHSFLPNSAKRILNFSSNQTASPSSLFQPRVSTNLETDDSSNDDLQNSLGFDGRKLIQPTEECLIEAKLQLKRCDWLGVSPVKSISANLVLQRMRDETHVSSAAQGKRKINYNFLEGDEENGKKRQKLIKGYKSLKVMNEKEDLHDDNHDEFDGREKEGEENFNQDIKHETRNPETNNTKQVGAKSNVTTRKANRKQSTKYPGCSIKPLSIQLKKWDWLGDSKKQSFTIQEVLQKGMGDVQRQNVSEKKSLKRRCECKSEEPSVTDCAVVQDGEVPNGYDASYPHSQGKCNQTRVKLVQGLFGGVMGHCTRCCDCEHTSSQSETFLDVSIPVRTLSNNQHSNGSSDEEEEKGNGSCVFQLLKSLSSRERLCNDNKYFCDQCHHLVEAEHFCYFQDLPRVLAIHLKRFDAAGFGSLMGRVSKISDHVSVPASLPCLMLKCSQSGSDCQHRYSLYSVVTHSGSSILRGHYRSYVKVTSSFNQQIFQCSAGNENNGELSFHTFPPSPSLTHNNDTPTLNSSAADASEDVKAVLNSKQFQSQSTTDNRFNGPRSQHDFTDSKGEEKPLWLECDDEFIRVFEEADFLERLSGESGALLGTPYVLFYHQNHRS